VYSIFNLNPKIEYGTVHLPEWKYIQDTYLRNLDIILTYYRNNVVSVNSSHLLVKILMSINLPLLLSTERYYANVDSLSLILANPFQLTSSINTGRIFDGVFYGKGNKEIIIAIDEQFDFELANKKWESLSPVKVLRHPFTDLQLNIPDGNRKSLESGTCVITINIAMLAIQYRAFYFNEKKLEKQIGSTPLNVMQFINMYVLPNMLLTHLDQALFNRFSSVWNGIYPKHNKNYHPFYLTNLDKYLNNQYTRLVEMIKRTNYSFGAKLFTIPAVGAKNMEKAMLVPEVVPTRQVLWSLVLARLPVILFLVKTAKYGSRMRDSLEISRIGETLLLLRRQRVFETLPNDIFEDTMKQIDTIISLCQLPKQV
jgi:hypothetical protein